MIIKKNTFKCKKIVHLSKDTSRNKTNNVHYLFLTFYKNKDQKATVHLWPN